MAEPANYAAARTQYIENADWYGNRSAAILRKEAIDWFLTNPESITTGERTTTFDLKTLSSEAMKLEEFLRTAATSRRPFARTKVTGMGR